MTILSFHRGHDASVCLYEDGDVKKYFLVERFTKIKHDHNFLSILDFIFDSITEKIDCLSFSTFNHKINTSNIFFSKVFNHYKSYNPNLILNFNSNHHLNHASLAFYNSEFDESLVVVVDGSGSTIKNNLVEVESVFIFNGEKNTLIYKNVVESFSSWDLPWGKVGVGGLYDMASVLIGNTPDDCGKAMGLSSYGSSNKLFENLLSQQNSVIEPIKKIEQDNYQLHADFCYEIQQQTQKAVGDLIEDSIEKTGIKKVCISGGYGMNIVANHYYLRRFPDVEFYFESLCNDSGCSIGSAIVSYKKLTKNKHNPIKTTSFHGFNYDVSSYKEFSNQQTKLQDYYMKTNQ